MKELIKNIGRDKLLHIVAAAILSVCLKLAFSILIAVLDREDLAIHAFSLAYFGTIAAGVCKELYDRHKGGQFDLNDIIADILGAFIGAI